MIENIDNNYRTTCNTCEEVSYYTHFKRAFLYATTCLRCQKYPYVTKDPNGLWVCPCDDCGKGRAFVLRQDAIAAYARTTQCRGCSHLGNTNKLGKYKTPSVQKKCPLEANRRQYTDLDEVWKPIPNFDYEVSNKGRVRNSINLHLLRPLTLGAGYSGVLLYRDGRYHTVYIHRLLLEHFVGPPPEGKPECNHRDGNKKNNDLSNLEWCSPLENMRHAFAMGLIKRPSSKLSRKDITAIRRSKKTHKALALIYGLSASYIKDIKRGKTPQNLRKD